MATPGSCWNKAGFIAQIMRGSVTDREMEDVGDTVLTFSEIKGLASGNPKIMQKIVLDAEYSRLNALRSSSLCLYHVQRQDVRFRQIQMRSDQKYLAALKEAIRIRDENTTDAFCIELKEVFGGDALRVITKREDAGRDIKLLARKLRKKSCAARCPRSRLVAIKVTHFGRPAPTERNAAHLL